MKKSAYCIILITVLTGLKSCDDSDIELQNTENIESEDYCVPLSEAIKIGNGFFEHEWSSTHKSTGAELDYAQNEVIEMRTYARDNEEIYHVINYENGGFIIISADERFTPVLAYSKENNFFDEVHPGISLWTRLISNDVLKVKRELQKPEGHVKKLWEIYRGVNDFSLKSEPIPDECDCDYYYHFSTVQYVDALSQWC